MVVREQYGVPFGSEVNFSVTPKIITANSESFARFPSPRTAIIAKCKSKLMQNALRGALCAILSTFIKLPFVFKTFVLTVFEWPLNTSFTLHGSQDKRESFLDKFSYFTTKAYMSRDMLFPTMWHFDNCRLIQALF